MDILTETPLTLRDYQVELTGLGTKVLEQFGFVYLAMEMRTGKTFIALGIANRPSVANVLFLTKKKAVSSIEDDYRALNPTYQIHIVNYESLHKAPNIRWDVIICDEAHCMGAFPKPSRRARQVHDLIFRHSSRVILMSGTPTPESFSQIYHQVYGIPSNPFREFKNFYRFYERYERRTRAGNRHTMNINGLQVNDYSFCDESAVRAMDPYTIRYSQKDAGFMVETIEEVLHVQMDEITYKLTALLKKNLVVEGRDEIILGDTPVKLMTKLHQLYSGTIKFESGNSRVIDLSKAQFIHERFRGQKIGIFYKFVEELNALKHVYGDDLTTDLSVFKDTDKSIALQIVSGREGISLKEAECLVYFNIDFSATSYWQSRDRMTTIDRTHNKVYWVFAEGGIEDMIYNTVLKKKDYTVRQFKRDLLTL